MEEKDEKRSENPPPAAAPARIFVGGLGESVTADELRRVFQLCGGAVDSIDFVRNKGRSFAYVDFSPSSHNALAVLFAKYNGCVWKGGKLKLEKAKEHYLNKLAREWAEEAEAAVSKTDVNDNVDANLSSEVARDPWKVPDERTIRIFFPRLRKVKVLPLSGTGKHKYSFQRIEASSLPKYFCGCEEHSCPSESGKQIRHVKTESHGINQEEVDIMSKVMNTLFQKQNLGSADNRDDSSKSKENEEDEDDLVINVVSEGNSKTGSLEMQQAPRLSHDQPKKVILDQRSKRGRFQDAFSAQKENGNEPPSKKKKQTSHDQSCMDEFQSSISRSKGSSHDPSDKSSKLAGSQHADPPQSDKKPNAHVSWTQKSSWKELVGDKSSNSFAIASSDKPEPSSDVPDSDNEEENSESDSIASTDEDLSGSEASDVVGSEGDREDLVTDGQSGEKNTEGEEEGHPTSANTVSSQTRQGTLWMQKSSWTQLVGRDSSFSISQPRPCSTSAQHFPAKPQGSDAPSSDNNKLIEIGNPARCGPSVSETKEEDAPTKTSMKDDDQTNTGNESSVPLLGETSPVKVQISNTCTFMRNPTSLKEWAKTKAALSGSLKRKGNQK